MYNKCNNSKISFGLFAVVLAMMMPQMASAQTLQEFLQKHPELRSVVMAHISNPVGFGYVAQGTSSCMALTKTLHLGSRGDEVRQLQITLNLDKDTQVSSGGLGSSGNESTSFGLATRAAVIRFQTKYASDVLAPFGLKMPTGVVGTATRAKLDALCAKTAKVGDVLGISTDTPFVVITAPTSTPAVVRSSGGGGGGGGGGSAPVNHAPVVSVPADLSLIKGTAHDIASGVTASDSDGDTTTISCTATPAFDKDVVGSSTVTCTAKDVKGASSEAKSYVITVKQAGELVLTDSPLSDADLILSGGQSNIVESFNASASGTAVTLYDLALSVKVTGADAPALATFLDGADVLMNGNVVGSTSVNSLTATSVDNEYQAKIILNKGFVDLPSAGAPINTASLSIARASKSTVNFSIRARGAPVIVEGVTPSKLAFQVSDIHYADTASSTHMAGEYKPWVLEGGEVTTSGVLITTGITTSNVKLRLSESTNNPAEKNVEVSSSASTNVVLAAFKLKAEGAGMSFDTLETTFTPTGANLAVIASDLYLERNGMLLAEVSGQDTSDGVSTTTKFTLDTTEYIRAGDAPEYSIVARINKVGSTYASGYKLKAGVSNIGIDAKTATDGSPVTVRAGSTVSAYTQSFVTRGFMVTQASRSTGATMGSQQNAGSSSNKVTFDMELNTTVLGSDDLYIPLSAGRLGIATDAGVIYHITDSNGATVSTGTTTATLELVSGGTQKTSSALVTSGNTAKVKLTVTYITATSGSFRVVVDSLGYNTSDTTTASAQVATLPVENFRTDLTAGMIP